MFEKCTFYEIIQNIEDLFENSTYDLTQSAKSAGNQLRLLTLIFIQVNTLMNQYPNTSVMQILFSSLNFFNSSPYFNKLINQYYNDSALSSPLVLPFQFYEPVGSGLVLNFEEHKTSIVHAVIGGIEVFHFNSHFMFKYKTFNNVFNHLRYRGLVHIHT